jgi:hypothetical protein
MYIYIIRYTSLDISWWAVQPPLIHMSVLCPLFVFVSLRLFPLCVCVPFDIALCPVKVQHLMLFYNFKQLRLLLLYGAATLVAMLLLLKATALVAVV